MTEHAFNIFPALFILDLLLSLWSQQRYCYWPGWEECWELTHIMLVIKVPW